MEVLTDEVPGRRWVAPLVLTLGMIVVPLVSLSHLHDPAPAHSTRVAIADRSEASVAADRLSDLPWHASRARPAATPATLLPPDPGPPPAPKHHHVTVAPRPAAKKAAPVVHAQSSATAPRPKSTTTTTDPPPPPDPSHSETGDASWYDAPAGTCAHRSAPMDTLVRVINLDNGRSTTCRVADRGPYIDGRIIDLSRAQFDDIAPASTGVARVRIEW